MKKKYISPIIEITLENENLLDSFGIGTQGEKDEFGGAKGTAGNNTFTFIGSFSDED